MPARNAAQLRFCLGQPGAVSHRRPAARGLFDEIELVMSTGLRPTPALSQAEMRGLWT